MGGSLAFVVLVALFVARPGRGETKPVRVSEEREFLIASGNTELFEIAVGGDVRSIVTSNRPMRMGGVHPAGAVVCQRDWSLRSAFALAVSEGVPAVEELLRQATAEGFGAAHGAFSPNGKFVLLERNDRDLPFTRVLVIRDMRGATLASVTLPERVRPWWPGRAWAPASPRVAFYFTSKADDMDDWRNWRGLAVMDLDGGVRVLAARSMIVGWEAGQRLSPAFWSQDGKFIYFTAGPEPGMQEVSDWYSPGPYCYRVDVESGRKEFISPGDVCGMASDGSYIILRHCPSDKLLRKPISLKRDTSIRRESEAWRIDLQTRERTVLPKTMRSYPHLSPSGRYVAVPGGARAASAVRVRFYRVSDWQLVGSATIDASPVSTLLCTDYIWISKSQPGQGQWSVVPLTTRPATRVGATSRRTRRPGQTSGGLSREVHPQTMGER